MNCAAIRIASGPCGSTDATPANPSECLQVGRTGLAFPRRPGSSKHGIHQVEIMQAAIDIPLERNALGNRSRLPGEQHCGICAVTVVKTFDACGR
jgi:hypothetical protein